MFVLCIFYMCLLIISCAVSQIKDLIIKLIDMLIVWIVVYIDCHCFKVVGSVLKVLEFWMFIEVGILQNLPLALTTDLVWALLYLFNTI